MPIPLLLLPACNPAQKAKHFLQQLETRLQAHACLLGESFSLADAAILPFVRQFAGVDADWFEAASWPCLRAWLQGGVESAPFLAVMQKYPVWHPQALPCLLPAQPDYGTPQG